MYSQRMDAINNEGIITCYRPYVDFETGEAKLREVVLKYDRSQLMHLTDEQFRYVLDRKLKELDAEFESCSMAIFGGRPKCNKEELRIFPKDTDEIEFCNGVWFHRAKDRIRNVLRNGKGYKE